MIADGRFFQRWNEAQKKSLSFVPNSIVGAGGIRVKGRDERQRTAPLTQLPHADAVVRLTSADVVINGGEGADLPANSTRFQVTFKRPLRAQSLPAMLVTNVCGAFAMDHWILPTYGE